MVNEVIILMIDESPFPFREVLTFSPDETDFRPSVAFENDLKASHCPFIIMLGGSGRVGKSTRANQILTHNLKADSPFQAMNGSDPVTMQFQYAGPIKFGELAAIHNLQLQVDHETDIFMIDCEGLYSLGATTAT
jgi:hypothetical protein